MSICGHRSNVGALVAFCLLISFLLVGASQGATDRTEGTTLVVASCPAASVINVRFGVRVKSFPYPDSPAKGVVLACAYREFTKRGGRVIALTMSLDGKRAEYEFARKQYKGTRFLPHGGFSEGQRSFAVIYVTRPRTGTGSEVGAYGSALVGRRYCIGTFTETTPDAPKKWGFVHRQRTLAALRWLVTETCT